MRPCLTCLFTSVIFPQYDYGAELGYSKHSSLTERDCHKDLGSRILYLCISWPFRTQRIPYPRTILPQLLPERL